jgi:4-diphosphocytidyl-2-C-methyl-D-erythritol kinase
MCGGEIYVRGYAKINLHLDVVGREDNGYHLVQTVMQSISLYDDIYLSLTDSGFCAECDVEGVPTDEKNIAVRAAMLLAERVGYCGGARIRIKKNIPMAAGMAGGSADGAATLIAMNRLLDSPLEEDELLELGGRLGADVPFCIVGGTRYADGRGDKLHDFPKLPDCYVVAACGGEGVSTPWGYGLLDRLYDDFGEGCKYTPKGTDKLHDALLFGASLSEIAEKLYNIFEAPVLEERPVAAMIKKTILESGAAGAMMSGSGPSVFGLFNDEASAERAAEAVRTKGYFAAVCRPV